MRVGEIFINVKTVSTEFSHLSSLMDREVARALPERTEISSRNLLWREYTGQEKGWLIKQKEQITLPIKGKRCLKCGYVEIYVI